MKRRNYTREILTELAKGGRRAVNSVGPEYEVHYEPRTKTDPRPWAGGGYRYSGREVHTVQVCGQALYNISRNTMTGCTKVAGHDKAHTS